LSPPKQPTRRWHRILLQNGKNTAMRSHRQIVNPEQQPSERSYRRERDQYFRDEEREFRRGADYINTSRRLAPRNENRDYSPRNEWEREYRSQAPYAEGLYAPSRDYGYERHEYYDMDPSRHIDHRSPATGYGNEGSAQARDFERWVHSNEDYHRYSPSDFRNHSFDNGRHERQAERPTGPNSDFGEGLYDYRQEQQYHEGRYRRSHQGHGGHKRRQRDYIDHKYHDRSDRHLEIVRPFKDPNDYSDNPYNRSEGFGREMVYPDRD
jgi:hypothetical protein